MDRRRRDRSIPRGNYVANYEGMRTHFPSLPTYTPRTASRVLRAGDTQVGGETRGNTRPRIRDTRVLFREAQTVPRSTTRNIEDRRRNFAEGRMRHPWNFRRARIVEEEMLALLCLVTVYANLRPWQRTVGWRNQTRTVDLLGSIKRKFLHHVYILSQK